MKGAGTDRESHSTPGKLSRGLLRPALIGLILLIPLSFILVDCSGGGGGGGPKRAVTPVPATPFQELSGQGLMRYLGAFSPMLSQAQYGVVTHRYGGGDGPLCFDGTEYQVSVRDQGARDLLLFLQGGGACWSYLCWCKKQADAGIPVSGILNPTLPQNPMADWNMVFVPYCDGSHFIGDIDVPAPTGGVKRYQRGLKNLSAALDLTASLYPAPRRIVLAGTSAGGFGAVYALPLVRQLYPDVPILLLNDSGIGIFAPGVLSDMLSEWNAGAVIPASCPSCSGAVDHLTEYYDWLLRQDPLLQMAFLGYREDSVLAEFFSDMGLAYYAQALDSELGRLTASHPGRVTTFIVEEAGHTMLAWDLEDKSHGISLSDWLTALLQGH